MTPAIATTAPAAGPHPRLADTVMSSLRGGQDAQKAVYAIQQGHAHPDALHEALQAVLATHDPERLRGFARGIGKALERAG